LIISLRNSIIIPRILLFELSLLNSEIPIDINYDVIKFNDDYKIMKMVESFKDDEFDFEFLKYYAEKYATENLYPNLNMNIRFAYYCLIHKNSDSSEFITYLQSLSSESTLYDFYHNYVTVSKDFIDTVKSNDKHLQFNFAKKFDNMVNGDIPFNLEYIKWLCKMLCL